ncbi:MAG: hypothetical protein H6918_08850 [Sphingomonadaceae bacterium]|nr:hypothetical protein [Sphingomonadaceae bacterium]
MKFAPLIALMVMAASPVAAQDATVVDLDGGLSIELPDGWSERHFANPMMKQKGMKDILRGASESRLQKGGTTTLVSYMEFKVDKPMTPINPEILEKQKDVTIKAASQYLPLAQEEEVAPRAEIVGNLGISLATLNAREGSRFNVAAGAPGNCVTSGSIGRGAAVWVISVASESCELASHKEMVDALFSARSE